MSDAALATHTPTQTGERNLAPLMYLIALAFVALIAGVTLVFGLGGLIVTFTLTAWVVLAIIVLGTAGS